MRDPFEDARDANERQQNLEARRQLERYRAEGRRNDPLPVGSLFDDVTRRQTSLF